MRPRGLGRIDAPPARACAYSRDARRAHALYTDVDAALREGLADRPLLTIFGQFNDRCGFSRWKIVSDGANCRSPGRKPLSRISDDPDLVAGRSRLSLLKGQREPPTAASPGTPAAVCRRRHSPSTHGRRLARRKWRSYRRRRDRRIGFAEFGALRSCGLLAAMAWGPGSRPDRSGSTPGIPNYSSDWRRSAHRRLDISETILVMRRLRTIAGTLGIDKMAVVGLSGRGPHPGDAAAGLPTGVVAAGVLGGVARAGPDADAPWFHGGGAAAAGGRHPAAAGASLLIEAARPVPFLLCRPVARPEKFKTMFSTICSNGSHKQLMLIAFALTTGFDLDSPRPPVARDHDHIVHVSHGEHVCIRDCCTRPAKVISLGLAVKEILRAP